MSDLDFKHTMAVCEYLSRLSSKHNYTLAQFAYWKQAAEELAKLLNCQHREELLGSFSDHQVELFFVNLDAFTFDIFLAKQLRV